MGQLSNTYSPSTGISVENKLGATASEERKAEQRDGDKFLMTFKHLDPVTLEDYPQNFQLVANKFPLLQPVRFLSLASERGQRNAWCAQFSVLQNSTHGAIKMISCHPKQWLLTHSFH